MWRDSESDQDFLNFTELADQIAALVRNPALMPISIGVFGSWGTGKSTVLRLVEDKLRKSTTPPIVIKFDAWLYQGFDDSRTALMEVVSEELLRAAKEDETLFDKAKSFAGRVNYFRALSLAADFGVGMALGIPPGLLTQAGTALSSILSGNGKQGDIDAVKTSGAAVASGLADLIKPAEKRTPPKEIDAFRKEFGEILEGLETTLVLFIDNLDRCLPDVAIGTLEAVRLFLFMPGTAFVIAADEDMIRHSVAKHFNDPQSSHVRDYLDKVIQVPLHVPQVGVEDLRAYMYSLFAGLADASKLQDVQVKLMTALQNGWKGETFEKQEIATLAGNPQGLLDKLAIADRLAPILVSAPNIQGNPRIVKRLLNAIFLRRELASNRKMNVDLATLTKLAIFERCTDEPATLALYRLIMEGEEAEKYLLPPQDIEKKSMVLEPLPEWKAHEEFIQKWRAMEPLFDNVANLRPAVFLSRDVLAPAHSRSNISDAAKSAVTALLGVNSINSPSAKKIVEDLSSSDRRAAMSQLIEAMRKADWSASVPGVHGAVILAGSSMEGKVELQAFINGMPMVQMNKGIKYLLKESGLIQESK